MPMVKVVGECENVEFEDVLVSRAMDFIEEGSNYKGIPCMGSPSGSTSNLSILFSLLFPSVKEMDGYLEWIKHQA